MAEQDSWQSLEFEVMSSLDNANIPTEGHKLAEDALTFTKSLWNLMKDQGLQSDSDIPDIQLMEKVIDRIYGELGAASLMFTDESFKGLPALFKGTAHRLSLHTGEDAPPPEIIEGFRDFAIRLENTSKLKTSLLSKP